MMLDTGTLSANDLAQFARENLFGIQRAAFRVRYDNEEAVAVAVFGNDNYSTDAAVRREVEMIRHHVKEAAVEEVGFGLSPDGVTWALILKVDNDQYHTAVGQAFQLEMVKAFLDDIITGAWRAAGDLSPESAVWQLKDDPRG